MMGNQLEFFQHVVFSTLYTRYLCEYESLAEGAGTTIHPETLVELAQNIPDNVCPDCEKAIYSSFRPFQLSLI